MKTKLLSSLVLAAAPAAMFAQSQATETPDSTLSAPTYENLEEVVVSAKKPVVQSNGEKVSYNVDEDPSSASSSLLEMLRKVPAVTVDGQDNIQVNGQSNFKIYVNGALYAYNNSPSFVTTSWVTLTNCKDVTIGENMFIAAKCNKVEAAYTA
ncbi:MAG: hypothetical protein J6J61_02005, partial [Muribaculaceae bacterium]|nr:hypothetical protein [Muribaculaceae bacterium]